jgi:hypothetical protein
MDLSNRRLVRLLSMVRRSRAIGLLPQKLAAIHFRPGKYS